MDMNDKNSKFVFENLKTIKRTNVADEIFSYFKELIISRQLEPGTMLPPESEICEYMGVGRSTLREALKALVNMGLIVRTKRGTFVSDDPNINVMLPFPDILKRVHSKDLIEFRVMIESEAIALAAKYATDEEIAELWDALENMKNAKGYDEFIQADVAFHIKLGSASHNELLFNVLNMVRNELSNLIYEAINKDVFIMSRSISFHERMFDAIKERNEEEARRVMSEGLNDISETMKKV